MLYFAESVGQSRLLAKRTERGALERLARGVYSDDFDTPIEDQIAAGVLGIVGHYYPTAYVSHSSAALRAPVKGRFFISTASRKLRPILLPGIKILRIPALPHPETERVEAPNQVLTTLDGEPRRIMVNVSSPLQAIFECLSPARSYPEKQLPDAHLVRMIEQLSTRDQARARAFAERNNLQSEYERFTQLAHGAGTHSTAKHAAPTLAASREFELYFYGWRVGDLAAVGQDEFRFRYGPEWRIPLAKELPLDGYEGPRMPAFFENLLPEGWTQTLIARSLNLDESDSVALLGSTRKYLSNLTLRPLGIPEAEFRFDTHNVTFANLVPDSRDIIRAHEHIQHDPETIEFWKASKGQGVVRLSGIQPKLPVALTLESGTPSIRLGDLRHACTHILKLPVSRYEFLVENEWATMELARRCGLPVASVRLIDFEFDSKFQRSLLVERYDIPTTRELDEVRPDLELPLQEDACSLLRLPRIEKYDPSVERVAVALRDFGLTVDDLSTFLRHFTFSWLVGNGDLHAKNVSVLRMIRPGKLGAPPELAGVRYSPLYDLVNTAVVIKDDDFALTVNGKRSKIRRRDLTQVAERWKEPRKVAEEVVGKIASIMRQHLDDVLNTPHLPTAMTEQFRRVVDARLVAFGA